MDVEKPTRSDLVFTLGAAIVLLVTLLAFLIPVLVIFPPFPPAPSDFLLRSHSKAGLESKDSGLRARQRSVAVSGRGDSAKIESLWIYPVKSCQGIEVAKSKVLPTGLEFDRLFTFAQLKSPFPVGVDSTTDEKDEHRWEFITQRQFPLLATVAVDLYLPDVAKSKDKPGDNAGAFLILRFPWQDTGLLGAVGLLAAKVARGLAALPEKQVLLPVSFPSQADVEEKGYALEDVRIWKDTIKALNISTELPPELQLYLGVSNKLGLFRLDNAALREVYRCAPTREEAGYQPVTGFQDAYPLHLLNLTSVNELEQRVQKDDLLSDLDARRFRANIIVNHPEPYDEETWKSIKFVPAQNSNLADSPSFHVSCRTVRCKMPNVDQDSGVRHSAEPDKALRTYRKVDEGAPLSGCLGMQLTPLFDDASVFEDMESWIEVGMRLEVLQKGSHKYIKQ